MAGAHWALVSLLFIPACFVMHVAASTTKITQLIRFSPAFTKIKKSQDLRLFSPLSHKNKDLRKQIKCFRNDMPFPHAVDKQSLLKEELPFFPIQFCQMIKRYKKIER